MPKSETSDRPWRERTTAATIVDTVMLMRQFGAAIDVLGDALRERMHPMDETAVAQYITDSFADVETAASEGYTFFFYGSDRKLPFATLATQDNDFDRASDLNRAFVFRLNIGVSKATYRSLLGPQPSPSGQAGVVDTGHDFSALDQLLPHPVYAAQSWVCVLNPSDETFQAVKPLLAEAYELAVRRHAKRNSGLD